MAGVSQQNCKWTTGDLIDLEMAIQSDVRHGNEESLHARDRQLYSELSQENENINQWGRSELLFFWLQKRRKVEFSEHNSPGQEVDFILRILSIVLFVFGLICAKYLIWEIFAEGKQVQGLIEPINVLSFALVGIFIPFLLSALLFYFYLSERCIPCLSGNLKLRSCLLSFIFVWIRRRSKKKSANVDPDINWNIRKFKGSIRMHILHRGSLMSNKLACVLQTFGLGVVIGTVLLPLFDVIIHSRVFGWQSTYLSISAQSLYPLIEAFAKPWNHFLGEAYGFPSLQQIASTRFSMTGNTNYPIDAAPAWANFMILSAFFYGFIPRILLYLLYRWRLFNRLKELTFQELRYETVVHRMSQPLTQWKVESEADFEVLERANKNSFIELNHCQQTLILCPNDLSDPALKNDLCAWFEKEKSWCHISFEDFTLRKIQKEKALHRIQEKLLEENLLRILLLQEEYMPPTQAILDFIQSIRLMAKESPVYVTLLGKPSQDSWGEAPLVENVQIWKDMLLSLSDPNLETLTVLEPVQSK